MARGKLTQEEQRVLRQNPHVIDVSENRIIYSNHFKFHFMKEYQEGKRPTQIFKDAGFDPQILGSKRIERAAHRWRESYNAGSLGSYQEGTIRQRKRLEIKELLSDFSHEECLRLLREQQDEIEKLKAELMLLKEQK